MDLVQTGVHSPVLYDVLYLEINIFCVILLVQLIFHSRAVQGIKYQQYFHRTCRAACACFLSDTICVMMLDGALPMHPGTFWMLKACYFFFITVLCFCWFIYSENTVSDRFKNHEKQLFIWAIPIYIELILMAVNIFYPLLYSYQDGSYNRGPLFNLLYLFAYVYVLIAAADAFRASLREENFADKGTLRAYAAFPVAPAVAGLVQYFWPSIPILCICLVFIIEFIFMKTSHTLISIDNLTQLNNRRHFLQKLQQNMNDSAPGYEIYLFMMDVDSFKKINDTFGHGEGDAALVMLADILKKAAGKSGS
jgi:hypothetical protein